MPYIYCVIRNFFIIILLFMLAYITVKSILGVSKIAFSTNTVIGCFMILMALCVNFSYLINYIYSLILKQK